MHRIAFLIDQRQDFFVSLAWARLLERFHPEHDYETLLLLTQGEVLAEFEPYLGAFDRVEVLAAPLAPNRLRHVPSMARRAFRFNRAAGRLGLGTGDVVVAYSFRELVANAFIRAVGRKPRLVCVRQAHHELELRLTRRRPVASAWRNLWNRAFGYSALRYRWLPTSNRSGAGVYLRDPFDDEFCLTTPSGLDGRRDRIVWPFPVLREAYGSAAGARRTILFLGERYPLVEGLPLEPFVEATSSILSTIRAEFPGHRLVFKPRSNLSEIGLDLTGWELGRTDEIVESLLLRDASIEKVISFKSSGTLVAALYGCDGYLLYPLIDDLPQDFRALLEDYFADHRATICFVEDLAQLLHPAAAAPAPSAELVADAARPLIDLLAAPGVAPR